MITHFKYRYQKWNEKVQPSQELLGRLLTEASEATEALGTFGAEEKGQQKPRNDKRQGKQSHKRRWGRGIAVAAAILIAVNISLPVLAETFPNIYELMYLVSPAVAQFYRPVQLADAYDGIRMEVVSAYIHEETAEIYITFRDLEGDRLDETTDLYDSYSIHMPHSAIGNCRKVGYDPESDMLTYLITVTQEEGRKIEGEKLTFSVGGYLSHKQNYENIEIPIDLTQVAEAPYQYVDSPAKGGTLTGHSGLPTEMSEKEAEGYRVLEPQSADPDFPIEGVGFTGIGYIDGKLHIQYAVENSLANDNHGFFFLQNEAGETIEEMESISFYQGADEDRINYRDSIFPIPQEELQNFRLYGDFVISEDFHQGNWQVTFPIKEIQKEMIKHGNASAHTQDRQYGTQPHTYQMSGKEQADGDSNADVAEIEAVLRKAYGLVDAVGNGLYNAVSGVRYDPHVQ